jgi:hypothetical protein
MILDGARIHSSIANRCLAYPSAHKALYQGWRMCHIGYYLSSSLTMSSLPQAVCRFFCKFGWPCLSYPASQSSSMDKYLLVVIHSSLISMRIDTPSLMNDWSFGNAPTTLVLLFSSLLILSNPFVVLILL